MKLGNFSVSLAVKNLQESKTFYEKLGFKVFAGEEQHNYLILKNEDDTVIGLFQGMFDKNIMTFNPGWNANTEKLDSFIDIRDIQKEFLAKEIEIENQIEEGTQGPASFMITDPDGNQILFDQHV